MGETDRPVGQPVVHRLSYVNVRGAGGRLLFRYDPDRSLVEIRVRGVTEVIDLTQVGTTGSASEAARVGEARGAEKVALPKESAE